MINFMKYRTIIIYSSRGLKINIRCTYIYIRIEVGIFGFGIFFIYRNIRTMDIKMVRGLMIGSFFYIERNKRLKDCFGNVVDIGTYIIYLFDLFLYICCI